MKFVTGAALGASMLWMLHDRLVAGGDLPGSAALFAAGPVAVVAGLVSPTVRLASHWPGTSDRLRRLHRPSPAHVARTGGAAVPTAAAIPLAPNGGLA